MSHANHPMGLPMTYAAKLAQRHSDAGFILAQLNREYGYHDVTREQIKAMRAVVENDNQRQRELFRREVEKAVQAEDGQKRTQAQIASDRAIRNAIDAQQIEAREKRREIERRAQQRVRQRKHIEALQSLAERKDVRAAIVPVSAPEIIACIAWAFGVQPTDVVGDRRKRDFVTARNTCAWVLIQRGNSSCQVGRWLNRDHSTILHAIRMYEANATDAMREIAAKYVRSK